MEAVFTAQLVCGTAVELVMGIVAGHARLSSTRRCRHSPTTRGPWGLRARLLKQTSNPT